MRNFKRPFLSAVVFFGTLGALSVGYSAYSGLSAVTSSDKLTVGMWTQVKDNFDELNARTSALSYSGGNVGIGTANPTNKLEVNGYVGGTRLIAGQNVVVAQNSIAIGDGTNVAAGGQIRSIED
ncbi:MAG: hypothetical protein QG650_1128 [Patescibacteria group bacterium]|nr:hypothetical protein [Patescibacteria group bacterium]